MITMKELLSGNDSTKIPKDHQDNLNRLLEVMNKFRAAYSKPMEITSGYRSMSQHIRIYADKGIRDLKLIPMGSNHLKGLAVDIFDPDHKLKEFIDNNKDLIVGLGLWFESWESTPDWVHFQIVAPKSKKRFFKP